MPQNRKNIHLICNAHIDPVWLWDRTEGMGAAISTFRTAVRICNEYDGYVFNHNEAVVYKYIEQFDKPLFEQIKKLVAEGKWCIMGGWYLQPDCNMPCGESFVRQIEYGHKYFREKFGVTDFKTAINFDPFGHTIGLVQIMAKAGYKNYICTRPHKIAGFEGDVNDKVFEWDGYCGSKIYVFKPHRYNSSLGNAVKHFPRFLEDQADSSVVGVLWGIGDHGGGPSESDMADVQKYIDASEDNVFHSTPDAFMEDYLAHEKPLCKFNRSLHSFAIGCYTSMSRVKEGHRSLENKLLTAEKITSTMLANAIIKEYPYDKLNEAWEDLMFTQFHDSLPGSSIQAVENDMILLQGRGLADANQVFVNSYFAGCGGQTPPKAGQTPLMVYNPHPYEVETDVECEYMKEDSSPLADGYTLGVIYDEAGNVLPSQNEKESSNLPLDWGKKVVFRAKLAPMAINRFNIEGKKVAEFVRPELQTVDGKYVFDNGSLKVVINTATGLIDSYCIDGYEYLKQPAGKLLVIKDNVDPWEMRNLSFREVIGEFKLASARRTARLSGVTPEEIPPVRVVENGDVRTVIEAAFVYENSALCLRYYLPKKDNVVRVNLRVFSMERQVMLKFSLPTTLTDGKYSAATAFGRDNLYTDGNECVEQGWTMLDDGKKAFGVINTHTYGSDCCDGEIRMSVLRTPAYSGHPIGELEILPTDRLTPHIDIGERLFDYYIYAGDSKEISREIDYRCALVQQPPIPLCYMPSSEGKKPVPFASIKDHRLQLVTVKKAAQGYTVRLFNTAAEELTAEVELPVFGKRFTVKAAPFEILSYSVSDLGEICTTSLIEA